MKEYDLLLFLMRAGGKVLERADIMHIESPHLPTLIHTVRGVGFILRDVTQQAT